MYKSTTSVNYLQSIIGRIKTIIKNDLINRNKELNSIKCRRTILEENEDKFKMVI